jgi:myo-inositol-1(or 4)-monophosphatase
MCIDKYKDEVYLAIEAIKKSSAMVKVLSKRYSVEWKISKSLELEKVTNVDFEINKLIAKIISENFSSDKIIGEEYSIEPKVTNSKRFWLIDPIDGTKSFIKNLRYYSIIVSFIVEERPEFGIIFDVLNNEIFLAQKGKGILILKQGNFQKYKYPIHYSKKLLWNPFSSHSFKHNRLKNYIIKEIGLKGILEIESLGLRAINMVKGKGTVFLSMPNTAKIWDTAAAYVMVSELGGKYTDFRGNDLEYSCENVLHNYGAVATINHDHDHVIEIIKRNFYDWGN